MMHRHYSTLRERREIRYGVALLAEADQKLVMQYDNAIDVISQVGSQIQSNSIQKIAANLRSSFSDADSDKNIKKNLGSVLMVTTALRNCLVNLSKLVQSLDIKPDERLALAIINKSLSTAGKNESTLRNQYQKRLQEDDSLEKLGNDVATNKAKRGNFSLIIKTIEEYALKMDFSAACTKMANEVQDQNLQKALSSAAKTFKTLETSVGNAFLRPEHGGLLDKALNRFKANIKSLPSLISTDDVLTLVRELVSKNTVSTIKTAADTLNAPMKAMTAAAANRENGSKEAASASSSQQPAAAEIGQQAAKDAGVDPNLAEKVAAGVINYLKKNGGTVKGEDAVVGMVTAVIQGLKNN